MKFNKEKWEHRALPLLIAAIIVSAPLSFLPNNWWGRIIGDVCTVPVLALLLLSLFHGNTFCEYCAAATPADTMGAARRKSRTLRYFHAGATKWGLLYLAALFFVPGLFPRHWPEFAAWSAFQPMYLYWLWSMRVHNLLEPWCPWCNGGDGGLREPSPDPSVPQKV